jgi:sirohydrochlorin cobaltochelatase
VARDEFLDAALILVGHGSTVNEQSAAPVHQHAAELRRRKIFARVAESFWKQEPFVSDVVRNANESRVFIVPLFISEGYFTQEAIPRELGFASGHWSRVTHHTSLFYTKPIGTHPSMTNVILARAREVVEQHPFPRAPRPADMALFIAGHGTEKNENSRAAIERQVEIIRQQKLYGEVHAVFIEEEPRIGACYEMTTVRNIVLVPFFISDGMHTQQDIPVLLGESKRVVDERFKAGQPTWRNPTEKNGKLVWYAPAIGTEPQIADVILERVREAAQP